MDRASNDNHALIVRLISAVAANCHANPDGTVKLNASVAYEMVDKVLLEHRIGREIKGRRQ